MKTWPDARKAVHTLLQGFEHGDRVVEAFYILPHDFEKTSLPCANTYVQRGDEGFIDRVTWVAVDIYAAPGESMGIAEAFTSKFGGQPRHVDGVGLLDLVEVDQVPSDVPRPDGVEQTQFVLRVTTRPVF